MAGDYDISDGDLAADIREARDAEWRQAVERLSSKANVEWDDGFYCGFKAGLAEVLAAMEAKR